jgi:cytochrome c-type biogenesis protein CcmH
MNSHRSMIFSALISALLLTASVSVSVVSAQAPTPSDDQVNAVAGQLYCPVCQNISLDVCPTQACVQWRDLIREKLAAGWTQQQIKDYFAQQYGDRVLAEPPLQRSFNRLLPALIVVSILAGMGLVAFALRRTLRPRSQPPAENPQPTIAPEDDKYAARIEEELQKRTRS